MAKVRVLQGRSQEAEALYRRVLALSRGDVVAQRGLGELYQAQGKNGEAIEAYSQIVASLPADSGANEALAVLYARTKEFDKSIAAAVYVRRSCFPFWPPTTLESESRPRYPR
jgi:tetratricopeptide (TPR) repeat protein